MSELQRQYNALLATMQRKNIPLLRERIEKRELIISAYHNGECGCLIGTRCELEWVGVPYGAAEMNLAAGKWQEEWAKENQFKLDDTLLTDLETFLIHSKMFDEMDEMVRDLLQWTDEYLAALPEVTE